MPSLQFFNDIIQIVSLPLEKENFQFGESCPPITFSSKDTNKRIIVFEVRNALTVILTISLVGFVSNEFS